MAKTLIPLVLSLAALAAQAAPINLALNPAASGFPSPLSSDNGWGGGSNKWHINDGLRSYNHWANGLAFTGGAGPYVQPAGVRQATIDFNAMTSFNEVIIWHHGADHTPADPWLDYWDGANWIPLTFTRVYGTMHEPGMNSGYADSDIYSFGLVTGSKVRYSFDNRLLNVHGTQNTHGWIYEFEVFQQQVIPEPSTVWLAAPVLVFALRRARQRRRY